MSRFIRVSSCTLNQFAMDFEGNKHRILESIDIAKNEGSKYRIGPELEISGYGCEDHFLEPDTFHHSAEVLSEILSTDATKDIICDFGMAVWHNSVAYNCRVICLNGRIICMRPKVYLAGDGNYREMRWFSRWSKKGVVENHKLVECLQKVTGQKFVPFGDVYIETQETKIAPETCEELFTPLSPHIELGLLGVEIFVNGSGSHHELRKLNTRVELIQSATRRSGGVYIYSNLIGCDGTRMNFDGCSLISVNGDVIKQGSQFCLKEVEVITATIDLEQIRFYRMSKQSRNIQSSDPSIVLNYVNMNTISTSGNNIEQLGTNNSHRAQCPKCIYVEFSVSVSSLLTKVDEPIPIRYYSPEEEIAYGPAVWCWDYLRRSGANGFFLPLSGGADSSSTASIVGNMCHMVVNECQSGNLRLINDIRRVLRLSEENDNDYIPSDPRELAGRLFHTCYMGTVNSSQGTRDFSRRLSDQIGAQHHDVNIDRMVEATLYVFSTVSSFFRSKKNRGLKTPKYHIGNEGSPTEDKALQNIQARLRMVLAYVMAQLLRWADDKNGWLLVLGSSNVDEGLRGYMTKYDCSSADLNPIGGICKLDLKRFLRWAGHHPELRYTELINIVEAIPTAELRPPVEGEIQKDEDDMGMTYLDLTVYGRLRKISRCGPVSMFRTLVQKWADGFGEYPGRKLSVADVAEKVKTFFRYYSINRHKMTTLTPSVHMEGYSPEDNRHDLRQIFYNVAWPYQFNKIDEMVEKIQSEQQQQASLLSKV